MTTLNLWSWFRVLYDPHLLRKLNNEGNMQIEVLTKEELLKFKSELIQEIKQAIKSEDVQPKQWLRSSEVRDLLKISSGTLQNLRIKGILRYEKVGGIFYYAYTDIVQLLGEIGNS